MSASAEEKDVYDEINITPMLDLAYVLLVIFIIMTTASVQGIKVNLPKASEAPSIAKPKTKAVSVTADGTIYLERLVAKARHIEIQVFGFGDGRAVHMYERECSVQRRFQKIIEESPSPLVEPGLRGEMGRAAVAAARACGYVNAGTIEFLVGQDRRHYFLEMNTRIQVEHPVTEMCTNFDLVKEQIRVAAGEPLSVEVFPHQIAFNLLPHIDAFQENGYTKEELKLVNETRKILEDEKILVSPTTVRVPVFTAHSVSVHVETERKISAAKARELFAAFPGLQVLDDPANRKYPMPLFAAGQDDCFVGRIREDLAVENGLNFWVVGDQLRKGAALNAVQIAEVLIERYL